MKAASRLFLCMRCHAQVTICSHCDRGQIYCGSECSQESRKQSCKEANKRYQKTRKGQINNALRQRRFREGLKNKVTDHGSTSQVQCASMQLLENAPKNTGNGQTKSTLICCFCKEPVSAWFRYDFLQRKNSKKTFRLVANAQAP